MSPDHTEKRPPDRNNVGSSVRVRHGPPDILIVEDEPAILSSLEFILRHEGWKVHSVEDGDAALRAVRKYSPRMLVLDLMLPKQNGFDVLRSLRAHPHTQSLPVLILTAKGQQQDKRTAIELGASEFVTKPYANGDVVEAVARLLAPDGT